jgi:hypothetical protein
MHAIDWLPDGCCSKNQQASLERPHLSFVTARNRRAIGPTSEMVPQSNNQLCKIMFKFSTFLFLTAASPSAVAPLKYW